MEVTVTETAATTEKLIPDYCPYCIERTRQLAVVTAENRQFANKIHDEGCSNRDTLAVLKCCHTNQLMPVTRKVAEVIWMMMWEVKEKGKHGDGCDYNTTSGKSPCTCWIKVMNDRVVQFVQEVTK